MKTPLVEKISAPLTFVAAAGCPICFSALAGISSALGLSFLAGYEGVFLKVFQVLVVISLCSIWYSSRKQCSKKPLYLSVLASVLIFTSFYRLIPFFGVIYVGMAMLVIASFLNIRAVKTCRINNSNTCT